MSTFINDQVRWSFHDHDSLIESNNPIAPGQSAHSVGNHHHGDLPAQAFQSLHHHLFGGTVES